MRVMILSNGKLEEREINNTLEELQRIVGGYIEIPYLSDVFSENNIDMIINEEGKFIEGLKPEIAIVDGEEGKILDLVYGNCIFASHDEEGETVGLNDNQIMIVSGELITKIGLMNRDTMENFEVRALFVW